MKIVLSEDVTKAWNKQVKACDFYEDAGSQKAFSRMIALTKTAMELENEFREQYRSRIYDENGKWHLPNEQVHIPFGKEKENPDTCKHTNAFLTYNQPDGTLYHCPDCGSLLDDEFNFIIRGEKEIPYG